MTIRTADKQAGVARWAGFMMLAAGLLGLAGAAQAQDAGTVTKAAIREDFNGRLVLDVAIDGAGPFAFFIDTAASRSAIFVKAQLALGLEEASDQQASVFSAFGTETFAISEPIRLDAAGRSLHAVRAVILPDWSHDGKAPDGILGLDFLSPYFVHFALERGTISLYDTPPGKMPGRWTEAELKPLSFAGIDVPLRLARLTMLRHRFSAIVDTGAVSTVLNWPAARRLGFSPNTPELRRGSMRDAAGQQQPIMGVRFATIGLGGKRWHNQDVLVADLEIFRAAGRSDEPTAIMGLDLLKQQDFAIDFAGARIYVAR